jgi:transcriptional/translational regulatory protein YebC/TACO1
MQALFRIYTAPQAPYRSVRSIKSGWNRTASRRSFDDSAKPHSSRRRRSQANAQLYDALDDHDDVQQLYANFDIDESEME